MAHPGFDAESLSKLLRAHDENRDPARILKRKFDTLVTRVTVPAAIAAALELSSRDVVVKQSPVPLRWWLAYRAGGVSRCAQDGRRHARLAQLGIDSPRVLAASRRPRRRREFLVTEFVDGGRPLREYLWLGEHVLRTATDRDSLIGAFGAWIREVHDRGVWQRDLKGENVICCRTSEGWHFVLLDITAVRFFAAPLSQAQRQRNFGQILDLPRDLEESVRDAFLEAYTRVDSAGGAQSTPSLTELRDACDRAVASRRARRYAKTGYQFADEEHYGTVDDDRHA